MNVKSNKGLGIVGKALIGIGGTGLIGSSIYLNNKKDKEKGNRIQNPNNVPGSILCDGRYVIQEGHTYYWKKPYAGVDSVTGMPLTEDNINDPTLKSNHNII